MLEAEDLGKFLVVLLKQLERPESLPHRRVRIAFSYRTDVRDHTSRSEVPWLAIANSPAARSCSSLAARGFDLRVSKRAFRAWVWACGGEDQHPCAETGHGKAYQGQGSGLHGFRSLSGAARPLGGDAGEGSPGARA